MFLSPSSFLLHVLIRQGLVPASSLWHNGTAGVGAEHLDVRVTIQKTKLPAKMQKQELAQPFSYNFLPC